MSGNSFEQRETKPVEEVLFSMLDVGDTITLDTESGSSYRLIVAEETKDQEDKVLVNLSRRNDRPVIMGEGMAADWEEMEGTALFDLRGSCTRLMVGAGDGSPSPLHPTEGHFICGERAWLGAQIDNEDTVLITSSVQAIQVIKAGTKN